MAQPNLEKMVAFLRRTPLFAEIDDALLGMLASAMDMRRLPAGSYLCRQGDPGDACFVLAAGQVDVLSEQAGEQRVLCTLARGQTVGEVALVDGKKRSASVRCKSDVVVFTLQRDDFEQQFRAGNHASLRLLDNIARSLVSRVRLANSQYTDIFSRADETMAELSKRLVALGATLEGADQEAGDLEIDIVFDESGN